MAKPRGNVKYGGRIERKQLVSVYPLSIPYFMLLYFVTGVYRTKHLLIYREPVVVFERDLR